MTDEVRFLKVISMEMVTEQPGRKRATKSRGCDVGKFMVRVVKVGGRYRVNLDCLKFTGRCRRDNLRASRKFAAKR